VPGPSNRVRTTMQKKTEWLEVDQNSGICDDLLSKFEGEPPSELSIFFLNI
jgi:hypothetical protein